MHYQQYFQFLSSRVVLYYYFFFQKFFKIFNVVINKLYKIRNILCSIHVTVAWFLRSDQLKNCIEIIRTIIWKCRARRWRPWRERLRSTFRFVKNLFFLLIKWNQLTLDWYSHSMVSSQLKWSEKLMLMHFLQFRKLIIYFEGDKTWSRSFLYLSSGLFFRVLIFYTISLLWSKCFPLLGLQCKDRRLRDWH